MKTLAKQIAGIPLGMIFFLAMIPTVIVHRIIVVAKLPRSCDQLITKVLAIIEAMTDNAWFPSPLPVLDEVKEATTKLQDAQVKAKTRVPGSVKDRNIKKHTLLDVVGELVFYVQTICIINPASALTIAESALMYVKIFTGKAKIAFGVKNYRSGAVELTGSIKGNCRIHEWQLSRNISDPQNWFITLIPSTTKATTVVENLKPGELVYFRHRIVNKDGYSDWDEPLSIIVT